MNVQWKEYSQCALYLWQVGDHRSSRLRSGRGYSSSSHTLELQGTEGVHTWFNVCVCAGRRGGGRGCGYDHIRTGVDELGIELLTYRNYSNNQDAMWWIEVPPSNVAPGAEILLSFDFFEMEAQPQCRYDYVELYSDRLGNGVRVVRLCGGEGATGSFYSSEQVMYTLDVDGELDEDPIDPHAASLLSTGGSVFVYVHSDELVEYGGISIRFRLNLPRPSVTTALDPIEIGTGLVTEFSFGEDVFYNPSHHPLTFSARDYLDFPLPEWLLFDPASRSFKATPEDRHEGVDKVTITATNTLGYEASVNIVLNIILLEDPDESSTFTCELANMLVPAQQEMCCDITPQRAGASVTTTADKMKAMLLSGVGGFLTSVSPVNEGARFDSQFSFCFRPPVYGGTFELTDGVSASSWTVVANAVPDTTSTIECNQHLAPLGGSVNCTVSPRLFQVSASTTAALLFSGELSAPVCTYPAGTLCNAEDVMITELEPVNPDESGAASAFAFSMHFENRFGSYRFSIGSNQDAVIDVWTIPDDTAELSCVTKVAQFRSVPCTLIVKSSNLPAHAPASSFDHTLVPAGLGDFSLDAEQADIASEFHFTFQAGEATGTAVLRFILDGSLVQFALEMIEVSASPDHTSQLACDKQLVHAGESANCRILARINGEASEVLGSAFEPTISYLSEEFPSSNTPSLGVLHKYLAKQADPLAYAEQFEFQFNPGDGSAHLQISDGVSAEPFSVFVVDDPDPTSVLACPTTTPFGKNIQCTFAAQRNGRPIFVRGSLITVKVELGVDGSRQEISRSSPVMDANGLAVQESFSFQISSDVAGTLYLVVDYLDRTANGRLTEVTETVVLVAGAPDSTSSIQCESEFATVNVGIMCTISPRISGAPIYASKDHFILSADEGTFSDLSPDVGETLHFTFSSSTAHSSVLLSDGLSSAPFQLSISPQGSLFSWSASQEYDDAFFTEAVSTFYSLSFLLICFSFSSYKDHHHTNALIHASRFTVIAAPRHLNLSS